MLQLSVLVHVPINVESLLLTVKVNFPIAKDHCLEVTIQILLIHDLFEESFLKLLPVASISVTSDDKSVSLPLGSWLEMQLNVMLLPFKDLDERNLDVWFAFLLNVYVSVVSWN